jgi:gluconate 2-dehydrogenase gamma chain
MADDTIPRRSFLKGAGAAGAAVATALTTPADQAIAQAPAQPVPAPAPATASEAYLTLTATEAAFLSAAYDTFIPADRLSPSGTECGLVTYIDRQLAGAWGNGARFYRGGPFLKGKPEHGYQLPLTPREFFTAGIRVEQGKADFPDFNAKPFFEALYQSAMEGFFADPIHGGNRDKASWRMVGYPGLPASYGAKAETYRGKKINIEPQSIADFS